MSMFEKNACPRPPLDRTHRPLDRTHTSHPTPTAHAPHSCQTCCHTAHRPPTHSPSHSRASTTYIAIASYRTEACVMARATMRNPFRLTLQTVHNLYPSVSAPSGQQHMHNHFVHAAKSSGARVAGYCSSGIALAISRLEPKRSFTRSDKSFT